MATQVKINWKWITFNPKDTWSDIEEKLINVKVDPTTLRRSVYVIRAADVFAIRYPHKWSPTLYIGEGRFKQRITSARRWLSSIYDLTGEFPLEAAICSPRVRHSPAAYKEFEAHLLWAFYERYGSLPLRNKIHEKKHFDHEYERTATTQVLGPGSGKKYKWALEPLKSNPFYKGFIKTHRD